MMIVMKPTASEEDIQAVIERIESVGARAHPSRGEEVTVIGAIGDREHVARLGLEGYPGVDKLVPILKPYKLASTQLRGERRTVLDIGTGAATPVEHYLHGVVTPEGAPQGLVEFRPPAAHDEQEPADHPGHGARARFSYWRLERTDGNQRMSGESSHRIVSSRWAPVEMRQNGVPISSSSRSR